jgi:uncharacterized protein YprB with RNaseH-like and TPR domain
LLEGAGLFQEGSSHLLLRRVERPFEADAAPIPALLARALATRTDLNRVVLLDSETTGLAGGTGTVAFLIGLAHIADGRIVIEQIFMPDYPEEPGLLSWLARRLGDFRALVTYNGKTFDMPLLRTRWNLQGDRDDHAMPHLDLLHVARRLFGHRLRGCGLANIEKHVLGLGRDGDLPGRAAPKAYFRYLDGHELETMAAVFHHNEVDLASTAQLLARVSAFYARPGKESFGESGDWLGLGEWAEHLGDLDRAHESFQLALGNLGASSQRTRVELRLADLCRRMGRVEEAQRLWRSAAERDPLAGWPAVRELVRWHETRDEWREAFEMTDATWQRFEQVRSLRTVGGDSRLPTAWRQWMGECERLRIGLRQASQVEQLTLF